MAYGALKGPKISVVIRSTGHPDVFKLVLISGRYRQANKLTENGRPASNPKHTSSIELLDLKLGHAGCLFSVSVFHGGYKAFVKMLGRHVPASAMFKHLPDRRTSDVGSLSVSAAFES